MGEDRPTRVLQIVRAPAGGIRKHVVSILEGLPKDSFELALVTCLKDGDQAFREFLKTPAAHRIRIVDLPIVDKPGLSDLSNLIRLFQALRNWKPDVVHGHGAKGGLYARLLGGLWRARVLYTPHGGSLHSMHGKLMNRIYSTVERLLYPLTDLLVFESGYSQTQYLQKVHADERKSLVNYNGIRVPENDSIQALREPGERSLPERRPRVGAFGLLRRIKGHDLLIRAAGRLYERGFDFEVVIFGEGEERPALQTLAEEQGLGSRVELRGEVSDVVGEILKCDVVVQPSRFESFGYVALEAMAAGRPLIATRVGGLAEIITSGEDGLLVPAEDVDALAEALERVLKDQALRQRLISGGLKTVRTRFNEQVMVANLKGLYRREGSTAQEIG